MKGGTHPAPFAALKFLKVYFLYFAVGSQSFKEHVNSSPRVRHCSPGQSRILGKGCL